MSFQTRRAFWRVFFQTVATSALIGLAALCGAPWALADTPGIGVIGSSDPGSGVGMYQKLELTFPVTTSAANLQLPYDATVPAYAANLKPDEDARLGVSVDCLLLAPGQTDWAQAVAWPAFLYRNYVRTGPGTHKVQVENLVWAGPDIWKVRFAPTIQGKWQYRVRVTDAGGTALSDPQSFVCVSSASKGFVRVSPTDSRYLQFDNGDPAAFVGDNTFFNGIDEWQARRAGISATGASALIRLWIAGRSGLEVIGGFANSTGGRCWNFGNETAAVSSLVTEAAHSGRFSVQVLPGGQVSTGEIPVRPGHVHTLSVWVKAIGVTEPGAQVTVGSCNSDTFGEGASQSFPVSSLVPDASGWSQISLAIPAYSGGGNLYASASVSLSAGSGGHLLVDDITLTDTATGIDALEIGDFERHVHYSERQSWLLDAVVDDCAQNNQYLRLNCLENDDSVFCNVAADGTNAAHSYNNFFGASNSADGALPTRAWQNAYVRYVVARWGYSTAVAQFEFNNEGALFNGFHYAAVQNFARQIHSFTAEGRRLAGTSFWQNDSGTSYPADFYDTGAYPDIDYADVHLYTSPARQSGQFMPFQETDTLQGIFQRIPTGGPNGMGVLRIDAATQGAGNILLLPAKIKGKGTWQISYQARTTGETLIKRGGHGLDIGVNSPELGGTPWMALPGLQMPAQPPALDLPWSTYSATFTVPDDTLYPFSMHIGASGGFTHGRIEVSDIKVTAPDGRIWTHYTFSEPLLDKDSVSMAQYLGLTFTSLSGDPMLGKPFSVGETDVQNNSADNLLTALQSDTGGVFMRQFAWGHLNASGATIFLWNNAGDLATARGWWKSVAAYQAFLKGVPLTNGHYRNAEAGTSDLNIIAVGQKDMSAGRANIFVYNRNANWFTSATVPASSIVPVTGTVTIPGLADGAYTVETWDTVLGTIQKTATLPSIGGALTIPVISLAADTAFKVAPVPVPALTVALSLDKASAKPGDTVTYTVAYGNKSAADALNVLLPWPIPTGTQYVSASAGGVYDAVHNQVNWSLGTVPAGQAGTVTLTVKVSQ